MEQEFNSRWTIKFQKCTYMYMFVETILVTCMLLSYIRVCEHWHMYCSSPTASCPLCKTAIFIDSSNQHLISNGTLPCCASGPSTSHIHTEEGDSSSSATSHSPSPLSESSNNSSGLQLSASNSESDSDSSSSLSQMGCLPNVRLTSRLETTLIRTFSHER